MTASHGGKRKLSLIIALMQQPTVFIIDEPTAGVDSSPRTVKMQVKFKFEIFF
jgi:ABC-type multidrug transport system ATPase subunit